MMNKQPKVSVIIPCYKVEAYLDKCVESVLAQTLQDFEIILVDDESPDRVPEMCDAWAARDERIRVIHKKNAGLGMACNSGLEVARGKYVAFLDSDDWVDAEMYQSLYDAAERYQAQMVFTGLRRVDASGRETGRLAHKAEFMLCRGREEVGQLACDMVAAAPHITLERDLQMSAKVVLYLREVIERHHIRFVSEREVMSEDLHFNLCAMAHSDCACVLPLYFYNYRINENSITRQINYCLFDSIKYLYEYTRQECLAWPWNEAIQSRIHRMFIGYVRNYFRAVARSKANFSLKRRTICQILNDDVWGSVWKSYPVKSLPLKHRLFIRLVKLKLSTFLYLILKLK